LFRFIGKRSDAAICFVKLLIKKNTNSSNQKFGPFFLLVILERLPDVAGSLRVVVPRVCHPERSGREGSQKFVIPSMRGISKDEFLIFFRKAVAVFHFNVRPAIVSIFLQNASPP
jgi:hypothetical protein